MKKDHREERAFVWLDHIRQDLRFAFRTLIKRSRGLAVAVVISMGLGVGATASVFSFVDAVVFRPLPVPETERVVRITNATPSSPIEAFSYPEYRDYLERNQSFSEVATSAIITAALAPNPADQPRETVAAVVSGNFFSTLQVKPAIGRAFLPEEDSVPGRDAVAMISHTEWQRDFGNAVDVIGRAVKINGQAFTIIGVAPEEFRGPYPLIEPEFYIPRMMIQQISTVLDPSSLTDRSIRHANLFARLKPGVTVERAKEEVGGIANQLQLEYPATNKNIKTVVLTQFAYRLAERPNNLKFAGTLLGIAFLVLGIACVNVSNLLLSTVPARTREMAVRVAMGAPRMRLLRQLLLESFILSGTGTLAGLAIAFWCARLLSSMPLGSPDLPLHFQVQVDERVVLFALVVGLVAAFMAGAVPAWRCSRNDVNSLLKSSDPHNRPHKIRARQMFVGVQVTVATVILVLSARLIKELKVEATQNPGFRVDHVLTMSLDPSSAGYDLEKAHAFYTAFVERLNAMPGVKSAAIAQDKPFGVVSNGSTKLTIDGYELPPNQQGIDVRSAFVGDGYFATLDIPIVRGRAFDRRDGAKAPRTLIVNETMVERYWPKRDPIGARVEIKGDDGGPAEVIGIARNAKYGGMNEPPLPFLYRSYSQSKENGAALFVHTEGSPESFTSSVRLELRNIAPNMPIFDVRTMQEQFLENGLLESRLGVRVFGPLGAMGLLLGVLGLYGVIAYSVGQRSHEIGIRMAVGASNWQISRMVLLQGLRLSGIATTLGIILAVALTMSGTTPDLGWTVKPHDPSIYIGVLLLMLVVTGAACYVPARRASMVDPNVTLRS